MPEIVLVVGSGGREHALEWKLSQSRNVAKVYTAPGNGGTRNNLPIALRDISGLVRFARENGAFTVIGPEATLSEGVVDRFEEAGLSVFGPTKSAARLETSKAFAKLFMKEHGIPTADFGAFTEYEDAVRYASSIGGRAVVKVDGLAAGKGVMVCEDLEEVKKALKSVLQDRVFGAAGEKVVVESVLSGEEVSAFYLSDGEDLLQIGFVQDHKRAYDNDLGPNTGGMGAYTPVPFIDESLSEATDRIAEATIRGMRKIGCVFKGVLYLGLMMHGGSPYVLEFNVRFGDPEAQALLPRIDSDLLPYLVACCEGRLKEMPPLEMSPMSSVCVVMVSGGYPERYEVNRPIAGLEEAGKVSNMVVFHAGTKSAEGRITTNGGRVLGITGLGMGLSEARRNAYLGVSKISWEGEFHRTDIGKRFAV